jgi:stage II sporulation protein E
MTLTAKRKIAVISAQNNVSADGGVSGDSVNLFCNKKDYFYALISVGMGSGKEAALTSGLCSVFLEKMLRAGNRAATSLRMLNNMIASRAHDSTKECSSTVDLLELDLMTGEGAFLKSGAAPSFVVRGKVVRRLQAGTVPIGILNTLDVQKTEFTLRVGDTVVMVSDGIVPCDDDAEWLTSYLTGAATQAPEEIVSHICRRCTESKTRDDCSVVALRILDADEVIDSEEE